MDLNLKGRRALVTGASQGLGAAAAEALAREGAEVIIVARRMEKLTETADSIEKVTGNRPDTIAGDLTKADQVKQVIERAGVVDILISNAGGPPPGQFTDHDSSTWDEANRLVLQSAINLTRGVIEGMVERGWGRLIYITSIGVLQPIDDLILSNTFRAGVTGFCKTISNNYARHGITANCVCPGYTATERLSELIQARATKAQISVEQVHENITSQVPARRLGQPHELASLIAFLAGDNAAYITGTSIPVDGGVIKALL